MVLARSLKSWEGFRPGFVGFGHFWPELRAIIGTKVEKWPKMGEIFFRTDLFQMTFKWFSGVK